MLNHACADAGAADTGNNERSGHDHNIIMHIDDGRRAEFPAGIGLSQAAANGIFTQIDLAVFPVMLFHVKRLFQNVPN